LYDITLCPDMLIVQMLFRARQVYKALIDIKMSAHNLRNIVCYKYI